MSQAIGSQKFPILRGKLSDMLSFVHEKAQIAGFKEPALSKLKLAVDEILTNIIEHSGLMQVSTLEIVCSIPQKPGITICIIDMGIPYNPLDYVFSPDSYLKPLEQQELGGNGIRLALALVDEIGYEKKDNFNVLTITKYITTV
jgi:anti-sigma regulatory factor (Ser/Thr protein kinase)